MKLNFSAIKVIAFDLFGTVFDLSTASREEIAAYGRHIKQPEWKPLVLPESWARMPAHRNAALGLYQLRHRYTVVTCSNAPAPLQIAMSKNAGISWDALVPLELLRTYKPAKAAYRLICDVTGCKPEEVLMVTANEHFGDLEAAQSLGMQSFLLRSGKPADGCMSSVDTIVDLASYLLLGSVHEKDSRREAEESGRAVHDDDRVASAEPDRPACSG